MRIRQDQYDALTASVHEQFVDEALVHLRAELPDLWSRAPEPVARMRVLVGCVKAERHGLTRRDEVLRFLEVASFFGPEFGHGQDPADVGVVALLRTPRVAADWPARRDYVVAYRRTLG